MSFVMVWHDFADLTWFRRLLPFTLNSSLQELQKSRPCDNANGSSGYSFTHWAGLMLFGSDVNVVASRLVRFPFGGGFVHTLRFLAKSDTCGTRSLSNKETTCTSSTSVVGFKLQSLLELHSGDSAIDHRYTCAATPTRGRTVPNKAPIIPEICSLSVHPYYAGNYAAYCTQA